MAFDDAGWIEETTLKPGKSNRPKSRAYATDDHGLSVPFD